jgi:hypothetical protein
MDPKNLESRKKVCEIILDINEYFKYIYHDKYNSIIISKNMARGPSGDLMHLEQTWSAQWRLEEGSCHVIATGLGRNGEEVDNQAKENF